MTGDIRTQLLAELPRLRRFGLSLTRSRERADDLVQAACERALASEDSSEPGTHLDTWMFRIMRTLWIDEMRKARTQRPQDDVDDSLDLACDDGAKTAGLRSQGPVEQAILCLPEELRSVLLLVCVDELSYREAAVVLQIPIGTVMSRLARARRAMASDPGRQPCWRSDDAGACGHAIIGSGATTPGDPPLLPRSAPPEPGAHDGFSHETLMMFADGLLDEATSQAVARALASDPRLAERLEPFVATRGGLRGAFRDVIAEPPPARLAAAIMAPRPAPETRPAAVVEAPAADGQRPGHGTPPRRRQAVSRNPPRTAHSHGILPMAMAAGIAAAVAGLGGFLAGQQRAIPGNAVAAIAAAEGRGLDAIGEARDGETVTLGEGLTGRATGTHRLADRSICRTVAATHGPSASQAEAVVCARPQGWRVELALPRGEGAGSFRPASGHGPVEALLQAGGATAALAPAEVEALIRNRWR